ncbi:response regulator [Oxalobacteraceae bacterium OM1]|nr:response regulator [Oxalobacteraceae bacterium OM1]
MTPDTAGPRVLLIDDQQMAEDLIRHMLAAQDDVTLHYLPVSRECVPTALAFRPTVVLVDLRMPEVDGFGVVTLLRAEAETRQVPIILLSSEDNPDIKAQAFAAGANDYLVKWPDKRELAARVRYHTGAYLAHRQRDQAYQTLHRSQEKLLLRTRELAQSQAALHQAQKMEAIGQLTGGVAHDFNNVLQVISGNLEVLRLLTPGNEAVQARIDAAAVGVERGAKLAAHLLAFARRQPLQAVVTDVRQLLHGMSDLLRRALGDQVSVETEVAADLWNTVVDPSQLENVVLNLAINGRDAMDGTGTLRIRARNCPADAGDGVLPASARTDHILIEVADTGSGMPPDVLERAFEPFFTTKPAGQGTGLGLSMAYGFVQQSGGHIRLASEVGAGTSVRIFLPRAEGAAVPRGHATGGDLHRGVESILVVEDESDVRATTVALLESLGYMTLEAGDPDTALAILESGVHIDLLFTDVVMPGRLKAYELAARAQQLLPQLQVLYASGYAEGNLAHAGKLDADVTLLPKPYNAEALSRAIRELLGRSEAGGADGVSASHSASNPAAAR